MPSKPLLYGRGAYVPKEVAVCPECDGELMARAHAWDTATGVALAADLQIDCVRDAARMQHRYWQSDWQPVRDAVRKWCGARVE